MGSYAAESCFATNDAQGDCTGEEFSENCYISFQKSSEGELTVTSAGCIPSEYDFLEADGEPSEGCSQDTCWCAGDDCNTEEWLQEFQPSYVLPPKCFIGVAGSNSGPSCYNNAVYEANKIDNVNAVCWARGLKNQCVENNYYAGQGDGCGDDDSVIDQASCEAVVGEARDPEESWDGTTSHCRWIPDMTDNEAKSACEADDLCTHEMWGCGISTKGSEIQDEWTAKAGIACEQRLNTGCYEDNAWRGEGSCYSAQTESDCDALSSCVWVDPSADPETLCATNGAGTLDVCSYNNGDSTPPANIIEAGFQYKMFAEGGPDYTEKCAIVATFRAGYGSATALGPDVSNLIDMTCERTAVWEALAEHVGHDEDSIQEYCDNFLADDSAMLAIQNHSPSELIRAAKSGDFATEFPGFADNMFIVTKKEELGECLFTAGDGYGVAICTCDTVACNDEAALKFLVDLDAGPMRMMNFIDGSLSDRKEDINAVVPGLRDADGKLVAAVADTVTESDVDTLIAIEGVAAKTNKEELWGIVQDYQDLNSYIAAGGDPNDAGAGTRGVGGGDFSGAQQTTAGVFAASAVLFALV
jgi:hypothetical protein